jgi:hypothetical protein
MRARWLTSASGKISGSVTALPVIHRSFVRFRRTGMACGCSLRRQAPAVANLGNGFHLNYFDLAVFCPVSSFAPIMHWDTIDPRDSPRLSIFANADEWSQEMEERLMRLERINRHLCVGVGPGDAHFHIQS